MIGDGCCAFVNISLGKGERGEARRSVGYSVVMVLGISVLLTLVYLLLSSPIIALFGGTVNEETFDYSKEYFFWISIGIPFYMFGQAMNLIIRADGNPKFAMISTLAGAVTNIILDPLFIFGFRWGMMGAVVSAQYEDHSPAERRLRAADAIFGQEQYAQIPMAVVGIVMKFFQIVISIVVGMAAGCIPIVGFNMGAGFMQRVKALFTRLLICEACVGGVALILVEVFPYQLIVLFGAANESVYYTEFAVKAFRIYLCMMVFACVNKACFIFLQAMGQAAASTALSMIREVLFGVGFALLLPRFFGLDGVLYSMPVSDVLTFLIAVFLIIRTYRQLNQSAHKVLT